MRLLCMTLIITGPYPRVNGCPAADSSHIMLRFSFSTPREALPRPQRQNAQMNHTHRCRSATKKHYVDSRSGFTIDSALSANADTRAEVVLRWRVPRVE
jgi:hypothetical protein